MNVLWTNKGKFQKIFSTDHANLHASGDGAAAGRCCRLCGGDTSLRAFRDTYLWEGSEERYDQLLYDCFGVRVTPSDCLICEWCVRQLRNAERFKALVHAAFDKPASSSAHSINSPSSTLKQQKSQENQTQDSKHIIELLKSNMAEKRKKKTFKWNMNSMPEAKRTNIQCRMCKQKYPMIVSRNSGKDFICSRCKKNQLTNHNGVCKPCNTLTTSALIKDNMKIHAKADFRGKNRLLSLSKNPSQTIRQQEVQKPHGSRTVSKYQCSVCPKRYVTAEHLEEHVRCLHNKITCPFCKKELKTPEMFDRHIQMHNDHNYFNYYLAGPANFATTKRNVKTRVVGREKRCV